MALASRILGHVCQEIGLPGSEVEDIFEHEFTDLGVDAILSKQIIAVISEVVGVHLPHQIFQDYPTIEEFYEYIQKEHVPSSSSSSYPSYPKSTPTTSIEKPLATPTSPRFPLSVVLQGNPATASTNVLLLPDGSGSGMSYANVRLTSPDVCLIGFNSPFLGRTENPPITVERLADIWIQEVRRRQPYGPYILGGWSAGGYYAFEVAKRLISVGETVSKLIIIDSPCRLAVEALPMEVVRYLSSNGLMGNWGTKQTPQWLVDHFDLTIKAVKRYKPTPIESAELPESYIIWTSDGVFGDGGGSDTGLNLNVKITRCLLEGRKDFGPDNWDRLLPGGRLFIEKMSGNHFTAVHPPHCHYLGQLIDQAISDSGSGNWRRYNGLT